MTPYVYLAALSKALIVCAARAGKAAAKLEKPVLFSLDCRICVYYSSRRVTSGRRGPSRRVEKGEARKSSSSFLSWASAFRCTARAPDSVLVAVVVLSNCL
jgi:hypothetical protein